MSDKTFADYGIEVPYGAHGEVDVTCPQCSGQRRKSRDKCLSVNAELGVWECHHCGWAGGLASGQWQDSRPPKPGAVAKAWQPPRPLPAVMTPDVWANAVKWFAGRGIREDVLQRAGVSAAVEYCPVCEAQTGHVLFPFFRNGVHVNTKHRCGRKHFRMESGAERVCYGLDDVRDADVVIVVEGEIDKLSLDAIGLTNTVSVPDGAPAPNAKAYSSKFAFLESAEHVFRRAVKVVLACDADAPGEALTEELARRVGREKCWRVTWPDGIKDANECLIKIGPDELRRCLKAAEPYPVEGLVHVGDVRADLDALYRNGFDAGVGAGFLAFDGLYRTRPGLFTVVTGIPGHGKCHFIDNLMVRLAGQHGWTFGVCSPENQPIARHVAGLATIHAGKPFHQGPTARMDEAEAWEATEWVGRHFAFILPEEPTLDAILERAKVLVYRMGIRGLVVDPWNELEHSRPPGMSETEYVSQSLSQIRRFARHHNVHVWLVAHPTKLRRDDDGNEPVPNLYDISGSAHFRNKADFGLVIWRDLANADEPVQVHVTKVRFAETGRLGIARFRYDPVVYRYREVME